MKSLFSLIAAVAFLGAFYVAPAVAAAPKPAVCTITSHPAGCVQPDPIWVHGTTEFGGDRAKPCEHRT